VRENPDKIAKSASTKLSPRNEDRAGSTDPVFKSVSTNHRHGSLFVVLLGGLLPLGVFHLSRWLFRFRGGLGCGLFSGLWLSSDLLGHSLSRWCLFGVCLSSGLFGGVRSLLDSCLLDDLWLSSNLFSHGIGLIGRSLIYGLIYRLIIR
jgi:hypothetical protein